VNEYLRGRAPKGSINTVRIPLGDPVKHPDCNETEFTKDAMVQFASARSSMDLSSFMPLVDAEAPDKSCRVAHTAALSRRCPIQDATDYWVSPEEAVTGLGGPAPGQNSHNVDT
jgi:hypothetical protein